MPEIVAQSRTAGFVLHPAGFFTENPALDVPPAKSGLSCCVD